MRVATRFSAPDNTAFEAAFVVFQKMRVPISLKKLEKKEIYINTKI